MYHLLLSKNTEAVLAAKKIGMYLGNQFKQKILDTLILRGKITVTEIVEATGYEQPIVSGHLSDLRDVGLVKRNNDGKKRIYEVNTESLEAVMQLTQKAKEILAKA